MSADTPTPPLPLGDVIKLLRTESVVASVEWNEAPEESAEEKRLQHRAIKLGRAATTLEGLEAVMRTMPAKLIPDMTRVGHGEDNMACAEFVARLRAVVGTGTPEEESDG